MSEYYKKIALEDVKEGQRVRIVERHSAHTATYEGVVLAPAPMWDQVHLGTWGDWETFYVGPGVYFDILLLEDVPKPKVVRTETVTVTHYDDGTKTEAPVNEVWVPMVIKTRDQFREYEDYLKQVILKDGAGDYWRYRDGQWCWSWPSAVSTLVEWITTTTDTSVIEANLPMTVVENVGD